MKPPKNFIGQWYIEKSICDDIVTYFNQNKKFTNVGVGAGAPAGPGAGDGGRGRPPQGARLGPGGRQGHRHRRQRRRPGRHRGLRRGG